MSQLRRRGPSHAPPIVHRPPELDAAGLGAGLPRFDGPLARPAVGDRASAWLDTLAEGCDFDGALGTGNDLVGTSKPGAFGPAWADDPDAAPPSPEPARPRVADPDDLPDEVPLADAATPSAERDPVDTAEPQPTSGSPTPPPGGPAASSPPAAPTPAPPGPVAAPPTPAAAPPTPVAAPPTPVAAPPTPVAAAPTPVAEPAIRQAGPGQPRLGRPRRGATTESTPVPPAPALGPPAPIAPAEPTAVTPAVTPAARAPVPSPAEPGAAEPAVAASTAPSPAEPVAAAPPSAELACSSPDRAGPATTLQTSRQPASAGSPTDPGYDAPGLDAELAAVVDQAAGEDGGTPDAAIAALGGIGAQTMDAVSQAAIADAASLDDQARTAAAAAQAEVAGSEASVSADAAAEADAADQVGAARASDAKAHGARATAAASAAADHAAAHREVTRASLREQAETELQAELDRIVAAADQAHLDVDTAIDEALADLTTQADADGAALDARITSEREALAQHEVDERARADADRLAEVARLDATLAAEQTAVDASAEAQKTTVRDTATSEIAQVQATAAASAADARADALARARSLPVDPHTGRRAGDYDGIVAAGESRASQILAQAASNRAGIERRRDTAIADLEAERLTHRADLQAERDAGVAAAEQAEALVVDALQSDHTLYAQALAAEIDAARAELDTAVDAERDALEQDRAARHAAIDDGLAETTDAVQAERQALLAEVAMAEPTDLEALQAEFDARIADVDAAVDAAIDQVVADTAEAVAEVHDAAETRLDSLRLAAEAATARVVDAVAGQKAAITGAMDGAVDRVTAAVDAAIDAVEASSVAAQADSETAATAILDLATIGEATVLALGSSTQTGILSAEFAAMEHDIDYDAIEVDATTGAVQLVRAEPNGTRTTWKLDDGDLSDGDAAFSVTQTTAAPDPGREKLNVGVVYGRDGMYGVNTAYSVSSGEGDDRQTTSISGGATFGSDGAAGHLGWGWQEGAGADAVGHDGSVSGSVGPDGVSAGHTSYDTRGGYAENGRAWNVAVGGDGIDVSGTLYRDGFGFGGSAGFDPGDGSGHVGVDGGYRAVRGGGDFAWDEDGYTVSANLGVTPFGGKYGGSLGGSWSVTSDADFTAFAGADATGRYGFARDVIGDDLLAYGQRDASSRSVDASVNVRAFSLGAAYAHQDGNSAQFLQSADAVDLSDEIAPLVGIYGDEAWARAYWISTHPDEFGERMAEQAGDKVDGVDSWQDVDWLDANGQVNDQALARGTGWSFDDFDRTETQGSVGAYGVGLTLGGSDLDYRELTVARTGEGDDRIVVDFTTMNEDGMLARFGSPDLLELGTASTTASSRNVRFELDPNDPADVAALDRMMTAGVLPGAEAALPPDQRAEFEDLYAELGSTVDVHRAADIQAELADLSQQANTAFLDDEAFRTGSVGPAEYLRRRQEVSVSEHDDLSALGFDIASGGWSETWAQTQYQEDGADETALEYAFEREQGHFLAWTTGEAETSFLVTNPEASDLALVGGSQWRVTRDQAQQMVDLGIAGADDFRVQGYAADTLDRFTGIGQASLAMDDRLLEDAFGFFDLHDASDVWARYAEQTSIEQMFADDDPFGLLQAAGMYSVDAASFDFDDAQRYLDNDSAREGVHQVMDNVAFIDHSDPDAVMSASPIQLLAEQARRDAWRANSDAILDYANDFVDGQPFTDVDDFIDAVAAGEWDDRELRLGVDDLTRYADGVAVDAFADTMRDHVTALTSVHAPADFAELAPERQEAWIQMYAHSSDDNPWFAMDMVAAAVSAEAEDPGGDPDALRDTLVRRLFRETERATGDRETAVMQYVAFIGDVEARGGAWAGLADDLRRGVQVRVVDEGVLERAEQAGDVLQAGDNGLHLAPTGAFVDDLDREVDHLFDNDGGRDLDDADQLVDRLEGLRLAAGDDGAQVLEEWVAHAADEATFPDGPGTTEQDFVAFLAEQIAPDDEYADKVEQVLEGTPYAELVRRP